MGKIIENSILSYFRSSYRGLVPHLTLITRLCILGGVERDWEEEKTCPRASPLTFIRITKGPKNKGKEKEVEIEEEERDDRGNEQANFESSVQERQRSLSPICNLSLDVREIHQEPADNLGQQSSNAEVMEMLRVIRQEMQERDKQLKIQLQLRVSTWMKS